jgi:hypothetical protein
MFLHLSHGLLCTCLPDVTDLSAQARSYITVLYNEFECYLKDKYATASFTSKSTRASISFYTELLNSNNQRM